MPSHLVAFILSWYKQQIFNNTPNVGENTFLTLLSISPTNTATNKNVISHMTLNYLIFNIHAIKQK